MKSDVEPLFFTLFALTTSATAAFLFVSGANHPLLIALVVLSIRTVTFGTFAQMGETSSWQPPFWWLAMPQILGTSVAVVVLKPVTEQAVTAWILAGATHGIWAVLDRARIQVPRTSHCQAACVSLMIAMLAYVGGGPLALTISTEDGISHQQFGSICSPCLSALADVSWIGLNQSEAGYQEVLYLPEAIPQLKSLYRVTEGALPVGQMSAAALAVGRAAQQELTIGSTLGGEMPRSTVGLLEWRRPLASSTWLRNADILRLYDEQSDGSTTPGLILVSPRTKGSIASILRTVRTGVWVADMSRPRLIVEAIAFSPNGYAFSVAAILLACIAGIEASRSPFTGRAWETLLMMVGVAAAYVAFTILAGDLPFLSRGCADSLLPLASIAMYGICRTVGLRIRHA